MRARRSPASVAAGVRERRSRADRPPPLACRPLGPARARGARPRRYEGLYNGGKSYHPPDLEGVLARAWAAGVGRITVTAGCLADAKAALRLARATDARLSCTAGVHPTRCSEFAESGDAEVCRGCGAMRAR